MRKKWQLFQATNFQTLMYPCFTFCRILGILPYKFNNSIFEASKSHYVLSTTITCVFCGLAFYLRFNELNVPTEPNFEYVIRSIQEKCYYTLLSTLAIVTLVLSRPRIRLIQMITEISSRLHPKSYQKLSRLIHTKDIFGFFYLIGLIFALYYKKFNNILPMTFIMYAVLLIFQIDMLYVNCVCTLKACFEEINNNLLHMQEFIMNNESDVLTVFYYRHRNTFLIMKLKAMEKQHMMISKTVQILNMNFSLPLLVTITLAFFEIVLELYSYLVQWHDKLVITWDKETFEFFLTGTLYYIMKLALISWVSETCKNQAQEIRTTIHDVLSSTRNEQIKDELQLFSLQTLHCKIFFIKGLNVDATFFATIVGTTTTYILIVLQFLITLHSCDEKTTIN